MRSEKSEVRSEKRDVTQREVTRVVDPAMFSVHRKSLKPPIAFSTQPTDLDLFVLKLPTYARQVRHLSTEII